MTLTKLGFETRNAFVICHIAKSSMS